MKINCKFTYHKQYTHCTRKKKKSSKHTHTNATRTQKTRKFAIQKKKKKLQTKHIDMQNKIQHAYKKNNKIIQKKNVIKNKFNKQNIINAIIAKKRDIQPKLYLHTKNLVLFLFLHKFSFYFILFYFIFPKNSLKIKTKQK